MANRAYSRAGIVGRLFNQPLAVLPETAAIVLGAVGQRLDVQQLFVGTEGRSLSLGEMEGMAEARLAELQAVGAIDRRAKTVPADRLMMVHRGVAHVAIRGETVAENDGSIGPSSGFTGYDGLIAQVQAADADTMVRGILLDVDSPGGEVAGLFEAASILMARRGTKPMRAMIRGTGASAAYTLACCADEVTLHELGRAGSNGVITMHADYSAALEQDGIKVSLFASGQHKADGNPFEALPQEVATRIQAMVDNSAARLFQHVAAARGLTPDAVKAQQAQIYYGEEAVAAGLVDKLMSWQDSMDEFEAAVNGPGASRAGTAPSGARSQKGTAMTTATPAPTAEQSEITQAAMDAAVATARTEASAAAASAERERFAALATLDAGSKISAELSEAIAAGTSVGDFALAQAKAKQDQLAAAAASAAEEAIPAASIPQGNPAAGNPQAKPQTNRGKAYADKKAAAKAG